nr:Aerobic cobaltochelatase subunit CobS [Chlamydiota bacterium]
KFRYGILPTAMNEGHILVLEELDAAEPAILFTLQGVMEDDGVLTLTENAGEIIKAHPKFRIVATANTLGPGDETGLYTGTHVLNAAHLDRWTAVFNMGYLQQDREQALLLKKAPSLTKRTANAFVKLANAVRKAADQEQVFCTFSTRRLLALARKSVSLGSITLALEITVLNKLAKNDRQVVYEIAQRHLPELESEKGGTTA